ncbi:MULTISPECIES: GatB/YqeY domain-containing protein [unclassified Fusibacter]|uniref:GatB/YqeY domain-containing protein n=1 Tax=unclassified Fusibacter TaxID=2624464 RepID=UPI0010103B52|nr:MULTISPECIES: GatB/YqeY domain-containing protein [unclassified Fusibacter]MCK8058105.1 GatB/YqeY domain-containing protein [Fusibacter sp. A2]NPE20687.1 GatB/YqeY domain-containing protein [Fusibacter sp. A1]RXV62893.1 GatB/YqeY domain-containing protein [Fusibacter sp. A1]
MALKEQLMADLKEAMKAKDAVRKSTITMLRAAIKQVEIDTREELSEDDCIEIIIKQIKQKRAAREEFIKGQRQDLADEAESEIEVLMAYMPEQLSEEEVIAIIKAGIASTGATSMKEMGKVMGAVKDQLNGRSDNKFVADQVKKLLS